MNNRMRNIRASGAESLVHDEWRHHPPRSVERTPPRGPQNWQQHEDQQPHLTMRPENTSETGGRPGRPVEKRNLSWVNPVVRSLGSELDAKERYLTQPPKSTGRSPRLQFAPSQPQRIPTGPARGQHRAVPYDRTPRQREAATRVNRIKKGKKRPSRAGTGGPAFETNELEERGADEQIQEKSLTASPTREDSRKSEGPAQRTTGFLPGMFDVVSNEQPTPIVQHLSPPIQDRASELRNQEIPPSQLSPIAQSAYSPGNQTVSPSSPPIATSQQLKLVPSSQKPLTQQPSLLPPSKRQKPLKPWKSLPSQSPRDLPRESSLDVLTEQEKNQLFSKIGKSAAKLLFSTTRPSVPSVARTTESTNVGNQTSELWVSEVPSNETIDDKPLSVKDSRVVVQAAMSPASIIPIPLPRIEDLTLGPNTELESQTPLQPRLQVPIPAIPEDVMLNITVPGPSKPDGKPHRFPHFPLKLILQQQSVNAARVFPPQAAVTPDTQEAPSSTPRPQKENAKFATSKTNGSIVLPDAPSALTPTINHVMSPVLPKRFWKRPERLGRVGSVRHWP